MSINVLIVSGWWLALHNEIVSWPPEKIISTATAEPTIPVHKLVDGSVEWTAYQEFPIDHKQEQTSLEIGSNDQATTWTCLEVFTGQLEVLLQLID